MRNLYAIRYFGSPHALKPKTLRNRPGFRCKVQRIGYAKGMSTTNTLTDSRTVFLVDGHSNLYSRRLELAGFKTESALDAEAAVEALPTLTAYLISLDLMLPMRGGIELLQVIRTTSRLKDTPILLLSNAYLPDLARKALRAGGNRALSKSECTSSELISISRELAGMAVVPGNSGAVEVGTTAIESGSLAAQLERDLMNDGNAEVAAIGQHCSKYVELVGSQEAKDYLNRVYQSIRLVSTRAGLAGCGKIAQLTGTIEAMLFEQITRSNGDMSPSSIQTLAKAVDCLDRLFTSGNTGSGEPTSKARVLLVDDDQICNMSNEVALKRANYETASVSDGSAALDTLSDNHFDLILLDINMPGMDGVEVCQKLRRIPHHKTTPVIFVTLHGDFQTHAQSLLSGGDDLISKPISPLELIVKSTVFLLSTTRHQVPKGQVPVKKTLLQSGANAAPSGSGKSGVDSGAPATEMAELSSPEGNGKKSHSFQETVYEKLTYLREALAEETKRREAVEQQAAENTTRRAELEAAIEENQKSQQSFEQLLDESQRKNPESDQPKDAGQLHIAGRLRALVEARDFVADKLVLLQRSLEEETKRREVVEQQMVENAERRTELEAALAELGMVQHAFQREMENAENPKQLLDLQASLAENQKTREALEGQLEAAQQELQVLRLGGAANQTELETKAKDLQASQVDVDKRVRTLTEELALETRRRKKAEQKTDAATKREKDLQTQLAERRQAQIKVGEQLAESQSQLQAKTKSSGSERSQLESRIQEL